MNTACAVAVSLPVLMFALIGFRWSVAPGFVGAQLGMAYLSGVGLSTQIGDLVSFFLTLGHRRVGTLSANTERITGG
jgi:hypothetical protein